jgi:hypothetical protein
MSVGSNPDPVPKGADPVNAKVANANVRAKESECYTRSEVLTTIYDKRYSRNAGTVYGMQRTAY